MKPLLCEACLQPAHHDNEHQWNVTSEVVYEAAFEAAEKVLERFHPYDADDADAYSDLHHEVKMDIFDEFEAFFMSATQRCDRERIRQRIIAAAARKAGA